MLLDNYRRLKLCILQTFLCGLQDDEYVVYSVNQQRLRYLVEFTINQEQPRSMVTLDNVLMETEDLVSMESCEIGEIVY